jgi:hypothetical protein
LVSPCDEDRPGARALTLTGWSSFSRSFLSHFYPLRFEQNVVAFSLQIY